MVLTFWSDHEALTEKTYLDDCFWSFTHLFLDGIKLGYNGAKW